uniref:anaerobic C4-dicarboxylate transporter family protein n=1 Tax=uncultured Campylobacter sp. TaxID=218934 RepID=UPI00263135A2
DIAIKENIRPERPMAVASVASQMGICGSPVSVAVVSIVAFLVSAGYDYNVLQVLMVSIPATFSGVLVAALWSYRRGKDLEKDPRFQAFIKDPENKSYVYGDTESLVDKDLPKTFYRAMYIFLAGILIIAVLGNVPALLPHFSDASGAAKPISMVLVIQMVMLCVASAILLSCGVKAKEVGDSKVFRSGIVALVSVYGVAWMADTYFANHMVFLKEALGIAMIEPGYVTLQNPLGLSLNVDLKLFGVAVKNLIDNAVKYASDGKILIRLNAETMDFITLGEPLQKDFSYYKEAFVKGTNAKQSFGLGLYIVDNIAKAHGLKFLYRRQDELNVFYFEGIENIATL